MDVGRVRRGLGVAVAGVMLAGLPSVFGVPVAAAQAATVPLVATAPQALAVVTAAKPKITGVLAVGSTLKAVPGKWSPKTKFSYQWLAAGKAIKKATKSTYKLTKAEAGKQLTVKVTGKVGAAQAAKTSAATAKVLLTGTPKLTGTVAVGSTLTVNRGTWSSAVKFTYSWLRDGVGVPGATGSSYKVAESDAGHLLSVKLTGKRSGYATVAKTSAAVTVPGAAVPSVPTISGAAFVGSTLSVASGWWPQGTALSYQWLRNGTAIQSATDLYYVLVAADAKQQVSVAVTGKLGSKSETRTTAAVAISADAPPAISGTPVVGSKLTAVSGTWPTGAALSYQWLRNGTAIAGATGAVYTLVATDGKQQVSVTVTGKLGLSEISKTSAAVTVSNLTMQGVVPKITGTAEVSQTLTAVPGTWPTGASLAYQWFADGVAITRGTTSTLRPGYLEAGRKLTVTVTGSQAGYDSVSLTSAATVSIPLDANYEVGVDIPAGTYRSSEGENCGWFQLRVPLNPNGGNAPENTIGYRFTEKGFAVVELSASRPWLWSQSCGRWTPVVKPASPATSFGDGDFLVGSEVKPGVYRSTSINSKCGLYLLWGASGTQSEVKNRYVRQNEETTADFEVTANAYRVASVACGTWTWVRDLP